jgi:hypothetical protein
LVELVVVKLSSIEEGGPRLPLLNIEFSMFKANDLALDVSSPLVPAESLK